jgi:hypothetical protein
MMRFRVLPDYFLSSVRYPHGKEQSESIAERADAERWGCFYAHVNASSSDWEEAIRAIRSER